VDLLFIWEKYSDCLNGYEKSLVYTPGFRLLWIFVIPSLEYTFDKFSLICRRGGFKLEVQVGVGRGAENANGLLRQYLPEGMSFSDVDDGLLEGIEEEINTRPREVLGFDCPMDYHSKLLTAA